MGEVWEGEGGGRGVGGEGGGRGVGGGRWWERCGRGKVVGEVWEGEG